MIKSADFRRFFPLSLSNSIYSYGVCVFVFTKIHENLISRRTQNQMIQIESLFLTK